MGILSYFIFLLQPLVLFNFCIYMLPILNVIDEENINVAN